ncbi:MAG: hypothetical protein KJ770_06760 [Actinobacteria bacterium]|nr:hypothetical protein [Actinomycetota bacterium]
MIKTVLSPGSFQFGNAKSLAIMSQQRRKLIAALIGRFKYGMNYNLFFVKDFIYLENIGIID